MIEISEETYWLTIEEAAEYLRRSVRAVYNLVHRGDITYYKHLGRLRFLKADLDASIRSSRIDSTN